jgi:transposase-like protein
MSEIWQQWAQILDELVPTNISEEDKILNILDFLCSILNQFIDDFKVLTPIKQDHYLYKIVTKDESKIILAMGWNGRLYIINSNEKKFIVEQSNIISSLYDKLKKNSLFSANGIKHKNNTHKINFDHFVECCIQIDIHKNTKKITTLQERHLQEFSILQKKHLQELKELQKKHLQELREL